MAACILNTERDRELLSQAIVRTLDSWPQLHRQIFSEAHYAGKSAESIAASLGVEPDSVRMILQECEDRLRRSLQSFRTRKPTHLRVVRAYSAGGCLQ